MDTVFLLDYLGYFRTEVRRQILEEVAEGDRTLLKRLFSWVERLANGQGYKISWGPPLILANPEAELIFDMEFVIAHLMLKKKNVFFIQIGANDGVSVDPMYKFATEFKWRGILLEPQPEIFKLLSSNYAGTDCELKLINAALSERDEIRTLYTVRLDGNTSAFAHAYSSFHREVIARQTRWVQDIANRIEETPVQCISMDTLMREANGSEVDILQIDAEGYDFEILKMIDFARMKPTIICYEHAHLSKRDMQEAAKLLFSQGYRMTRNNLDTIAYQQAFTYGWRT